MEIKKCKDIDRRCTECGASMKSEFSEIDKLLGTPHTEKIFELLFGEGVQVREYLTNEIPCIILQGANYELRNVSTLNADWKTEQIDSE